MMGSLEDIRRRCDSFEERISLHSGEEFLFRALKTEDSALLASYFQSLSENTRKVFGPHPFTKEQAEALCAQIDCGPALRLIAVTERGARPKIVAYFILGLRLSEGDEKRYRDRGTVWDNPDSVCSIAPSVADEYQNRGLGGILMGRTLALARHVGRSHVLLQGGVRADNARGIHFYRKCGFRKVASFSGTVDSFDMILDLAQAPRVKRSEHQRNVTAARIGSKER